MVRREKLFGVGVVLSLCVLPSMAFAQPSAGTVTREQLDRQAEKKIEQTITTPKPAASVEAQEVSEAAPQGQAVQVNTISVEGNTLLKAEEIDVVVAKYENKPLTIAQIRQLTAEITALYRSKGFITSRAFLPPQTIDGGALIIQIVEGKWGDLTINGNKYFSTRLIRKYFAVKPNSSFDYNNFIKSLECANEHRDRSIKSNLAPGKEKGTTDVVLDVTERNPFHVGMEYDNWASRDLNRYRYTLKLQHTNLTGHDDLLYLDGRVTDHNRLLLSEGRYLYPLTNKLSVGVNFLRSKTNLDDKYQVLAKRGTGNVYGLVLMNEFIRTDNIQMRGNIAFDHKEIRDYTLGSLTSHDSLRVLRTGMEWDVSDSFGRNILDLESDLGLEIMGAMEKKDPMASRVGAGSEFHKGLVSYYRLQPMPFDSQLLLKNNLQYTNHDLVAVEQFQIGGPTSVRAYSPAEYSADRGHYSSVEWTCPFYGLSKTMKVPGRNATFYNALRALVFFDTGSVYSNSVLADEKKHHTLTGYGFGVRFNPDKDLAIRVETGFPITDQSVDGDKAHTWFQMQMMF